MYAVVANLILARVGRPHDIRVAVIGSVAAISTVYTFINGISGVRVLAQTQTLSLGLAWPRSPISFCTLYSIEKNGKA
jgi:hypothetical protein